LVLAVQCSPLQIEPAEMSSMSPQVALEKDVVTTKEELEEWKRKMAEQRRRGGEPEHPPALDPKGKGGWQGDVNLLVAFLKGLRSLMELLIKDRVPEEVAARFNAVFPEVAQNIDWAISDLYDIANASDPKGHPCYVALEARGLTEESLELKMAETDDRIHDSPPVAVLERFDSIMGSLIPVLYSLEPVKEFKEVLESRIKHGGDKMIQTLDIFRDQQPWHRKSAK
jgi:hypothetical protein